MPEPSFIESCIERIEELQALGMESSVYTSENGDAVIGVRIKDPVTEPHVKELTELALTVAIYAKAQGIGGQ